MAFEYKAFVFGNLMLAFFNFVVSELDYRAAISANKVIVMIAVVKFKNSLATIKLASYQNARLFKLGQYAVNRGQAYVDILGHKRTVDVFGTLMA